MNAPTVSHDDTTTRRHDLLVFCVVQPSALREPKSDRVSELTAEGAEDAEDAQRLWQRAVAEGLRDARFAR